MDWLESHFCRTVLGVQIQEIIGRYHCRCTWNKGRQYVLISAAGIHSVQAQHLGLDETSAGL